MYFVHFGSVIFADDQLHHCHALPDRGQVNTLQEGSKIEIEEAVDRCVNR